MAIWHELWFGGTPLPANNHPMVGERRQLQWVNTLGGPHLVLPEQSASAWEGGLAPSNGRVVEANFRCDPNGPATDYDRACSVKDWLGVILIGDGQALVLGGDHNAAALYRTPRDQHFILRWVYAPSETDFLVYFHDTVDRLSVESVKAFCHPGGKVLLMDACDVPGQWAVQPSEFLLPQGRYRVVTSHSKCEDVFIIAHQLLMEPA